MSRKVIQEPVLLEQTGMYESVFSLANGKIGVRGFHEFLPETWVEDAIYMNGFHDTEDYIYGETAFGYAKKKQKMLALPNLLEKKITIDGVLLTTDLLVVSKSTRQLDLETGTLQVQYYFDITKDLSVTIAIERFVSLVDKEAIWQRTIFTTSKAATIVVERGTRKKRMDKQGFDPRLGSLRKTIALHEKNHKELENGYITTYQTDESELHLTTGIYVQGGVVSSDAKEQIFTTFAQDVVQMDELFLYSDEHVTVAEFNT